MSLRTRLAFVLAGVMAGPLIAAALTLWIISAAVNRAAVDRATDAAAAAGLALHDLCLAAGDGARSAADLLAVDPAPITQARARAVASRVTEGHSDLHVVVTGPDGRVIAVAGPPTELSPGQGPLAPGLSCSGDVGDPDHAVYAESVPVLDKLAGTARATVTAWFLVDDGMLGQLLHDLALDVDDIDLALLSPSDPVVLARTSAAPLALAVRDVAKGDRQGVVQGDLHTVTSHGAGAPYRILVTTSVGGVRKAGLLVAVILLVTFAVAGVLVKVLAARLTRPLDQLAAAATRLGQGDYTARTRLTGEDEVGRLGEAFDTMAAELETTVAELRRNRDALSETFARFGEALGRTHDLRGLLETVLEAAMAGGGCVAGTALLGDVGGLEERVNAVAEGAPASITGAFGALARLAAEAVAVREPVMVEALDGTGPAIAVPLQREERVVGALALARAPGAGAFEPAALEAVHALAASAGTAVANVRAHDETRRLSVTDPLTGAGNFRHLSTTLARETERAHRFKRPLAVLMLDLDNFKTVNDTFGHAFGDGVLREFARRLQTCVREVDTVARYGGEEFAVVLPETDAVSAARVAGRIVDVVHGDPFVVSGREREVTVSVGVASFPEHGRSGAEVMRAADSALYAAKNSGRDRWILAGDAVPARRRGTPPAGARSRTAGDAGLTG